MIGLPSLQAIDRAQGARIWMACEATDMRRGFDRLAERVKTVIGENPQSEPNTALSKTPIRIAHAGRGTDANSPHGGACCA